MDQVLNVWIRCGSGGFQRTDSVGKADILFQEKAFVSGFQIPYIILGKSTTLQADQVQSTSAGGIAIDDHERRHVLDDF